MTPVSCNPQDAVTEAEVFSYRAAVERLSRIWPDAPLIVDALVCAGFDVVGWWPLGDLPEMTL